MLNVILTFTRDKKSYYMLSVNHLVVTWAVINQSVLPSAFTVFREVYTEGFE